MKLDILAFAAHPDDVELACSGTLLKHRALGYTVGVIDLTLGQLSSRGNLTLRALETEQATKILGLNLRENLHLEDGFFINDAATRLKLIEKLRLYRPKIVLCNAPYDRHPDHARAAQLVSEACFYSGLAKIESFVAQKPQQAYRPEFVYHYIQDEDLKPNFVVDISDFMADKMRSIRAFSSQFFSENNSSEPITPIATKEFLAFIEGRASHFGRMIFSAFGEGFITQRPIEVKDLLANSKQK